MITFKATFDRALLPRRFTWLAHHTCFISAADWQTAHEYHGSQVMRAIEPRKPRFEELCAIVLATCFERLDYTASIFDVLGIDVSKERGETPPVVGETGTPQFGDGHE